MYFFLLTDPRLNRVNVLDCSDHDQWSLLVGPGLTSVLRISIYAYNFMMVRFGFGQSPLSLVLIRCKIAQSGFG